MYKKENKAKAGRPREGDREGTEKETGRRKEAAKGEEPDRNAKDIQNTGPKRQKKKPEKGTEGGRQRREPGDGSREETQARKKGAGRKKACPEEEIREGEEAGGAGKIRPGRNGGKHRRQEGLPP